MIFQRETWRGFMDEAAPLFVKHWKEIAHYPDIELKPAHAAYIFAEDTGQLRVFTARDEGELIGYAVFFVRPNMHYADSIQASQDIVFIAPERRGFGSKFISWCDDKLRDDGVQVVYHHVKADHNWSKLLERQGYTLVDLLYSKRLDAASKE